MGLASADGHLELAFEHFKRAHNIDPDREMARKAMEMLDKSGSKNGPGSDIAAAAAAATAAYEEEQKAGAEAADEDDSDSQPETPEALVITKPKKRSKRISTKKSASI